MRTAIPLSVLFLSLASPARAQSAPAAPSEAVHITAATAPLPEEFRTGATVLGYRSGGRQLTELRRGEGAFICLADDPADDRFHVACYHRSLEPFMARGRQLRAERRAEEVDTVRNSEIRTGRLKMPEHPAALYSLTGKPDSFDSNTGAISGARPLYVVYIPFATAASTGLSAKPAANAPWIMFPGTPRAHIMFVPEME